MAGLSANRPRMASEAVLLEAALCRLPALLEPGAQSWDRRCFPFAFGLGEFVDGVEQGCGVPGRRKATGDGAKPLGEAVEDRLG